MDTKNYQARLEKIQGWSEKNKSLVQRRKENLYISFVQNMWIATNGVVILSNFGSLEKEGVKKTLRRNNHTERRFI